MWPLIIIIISVYIFWNCPCVLSHYIQEGFSRHHWCPIS